MAGYAVRQFTCPKAVTHPTINRAQCRATELIETNHYTKLPLCVAVGACFMFMLFRLRQVPFPMLVEFLHSDLSSEELQPYLRNYAAYRQCYC